MESLFWALRTLGKLLVNEVEQLMQVRPKMDRLKDEMEWMQASIKEADKQNQFANEVVRQWVKEIRNAASLAECIVAKYAFESHLILKFHRNSSKYNPVVLHDIHNDMRKLESKLHNIKYRGDTYHITGFCANRNLGINKIEQRRRSAYYKKSEQVISFENHINCLKDQLYSDKLELDVVGVVGMGGVGKTTLASLVFKSIDVELFPIRVWLDLSQNYIELKGIQSLLREIAKQTNPQTEDLKGESTRELSELVERNLRGKRYLIVMDDMWEEEVWDLIKDHLPDESNASRIMITTRNENVARCPASHSDPYKLQCLNEKQSWNFFTKFIFGNEERLNRECTGLLLTQAKELVDKCGGSPLALDCLVNALAGKGKTLEAWKSALRHDKWLNEGSRCMDTLKLSYTCLPFYLKWCFLYLSAFPKGSEIEVEKLIKLWVAEGFVNMEDDNENTDVEDKAMSYLEELNKRCLVEVIGKTNEQSVNGRARYCTIHNLHRLLSMAEAKALDFMDFCVKNPINDNAHRLAVHCESSSSTRELNLVRSCFSLRTLLLFRSGESSIQCKRFSVLKVIDLEGARIVHLPNEIGDMLCLQYLSIKKTPCRELPESIIELPNLETLDCRVEGEFSMPKKIWMIGTLTHVYGKKLRCDCDLMCASKLKTIESVFLCRRIEESINRCNELRVLHIHIPDHSKKINQSNSRFWIDLQNLSALESLYFNLSGYTYMNMTCLERKFPKLQSLTLENFEYEDWIVQEPSMMSLKILNLISCTRLRELPFGLHGCSELQKLNCVSMGRTFREWYQNQGAKGFSHVTWNFSPSI